jgi:hypothetical protein
MRSLRSCIALAFVTWCASAPALAQSGADGSAWRELAIASLSRVQPVSMSAGKIAGIALGSAGAAVSVLWLIALAAFD